MSVTLVATDGSPQANAYCDQAYADNFLTTQRPYVGTEWTNLSNDQKCTLLIWATTFLDDMVDWFGYKATRDQALRWPRSGVYDPDGFYVDKTIVPDRIRQWTAETAWAYSIQNRAAEPGSLGQGITDVTVGPIRVKIDPHMQLPYFPPYLATRISRYGVLIANGGPGGVMMARLLRV